jgi:hypothetical protein
MAAVKAGGNNKFKMGGTGSKQEDQIITVALEKQSGRQVHLQCPFKGGGEVATQLVGKHIDSTVNNPIEAVAQWRAGQPATALRIRRPAHAVQGEGHQGHVVGDIPTCKERASHRLPDAARHLHGRRRAARPGEVLRGPAREGAPDAGVEEVHGGRRVQPDDHDGKEYADWVAKNESCTWTS